MKLKCRNQMNTVVAVYESNGLVHRVIGTPPEVYIQLDVLCDVLSDFHLVSVTTIEDKAKGDRPGI